jgi:putative salt-induced outer membrane protein YdiY
MSNPHSCAEIIVSLCCAAVFVSNASAQTKATITLCNKDVIVVDTFVDDGEWVTCVHPSLGELRIRKSNVESIEDQPSPASGKTPPSRIEHQETNIQKEAPEARVRTWRRNVSVAINGAEGKDDGLHARVGVELNRATSKYRTRLKSDYVRSRDGSGEQRSHFDAELRNDLLLRDSPWRIFGTAKVQQDDFADWDWRTTATAGFGYELIESEQHELIGRSGAGASKDFGGENEDLTPIGLLGADYVWRISDRNTLAAAIEYTPDITDVDEFRTDSAIAYHVKLREDDPLTLRIGTGHRFDSRADRSTRNDYEYFVALGWDF